MKDNNPVCPMCAKPVIEPISVPTESRPTQFQDAAEKLARSLGHKMNCAFTGCTCGAGEEQAHALYEYENLKRELASLPVGESRRPKIVCLCGSTRFYEHFQRANYDETMLGNIVLSVGFYPHAQKEMHHEEAGCTPEQKIGLDELHKRKIDLADEVLVLNVGGYIGSSTRSEIDYAEAHGKPVRYLETELGLGESREPLPGDVSKSSNETRNT